MIISLSQIEQDLVAAMKSKDQVAVETLRGLKTRIQNEKIAKTKDLVEDDLITLVKSEVKRRKEAAEVYNQGGRAELASKELSEAAILGKYMPAQMSEQEISQIADSIITEQAFASADFGKAMGLLKAKVGNAADGSMLAKILKEKLK